MKSFLAKSRVRCSGPSPSAIPPRGGPDSTQRVDCRLALGKHRQHDPVYHRFARVTTISALAFLARPRLRTGSCAAASRFRSPRSHRHGKQCGHIGPRRGLSRVPGRLAAPGQALPTGPRDTTTMWQCSRQHLARSESSYRHRLMEPDHDRQAAETRPLPQMADHVHIAVPCEEGPAGSAPSAGRRAWV